jgi:small Trp-rich protein
MVFLILGVILLVMKMTAFGPVAEWSWWIVLAPFGLAVLWWYFADATGLTKKRAMDKMERRKTERRERALDNLGLRHLHRRPVRPHPEPSRKPAASRPPIDADAPPAPQRRDPTL